jgi:small subunit ribosomal protein S1
MIHVSEISPEKRIQHPADVLRVGQVVNALVIGLEPEKRQMKLSLKQLVPTGLDEYIAEHKEGDLVTGRLMEESGGQGRVELGQGIYAACTMKVTAAAAPEAAKSAKGDLSSLSAMLQTRWKTGPATAKAEPPRAGQVRSFRITHLDQTAKKIVVELT